MVTRKVGFDGQPITGFPGSANDLLKYLSLYPSVERFICAHRCRGRFVIQGLRLMFMSGLGRSFQADMPRHRHLMYIHYLGAKTPSSHGSPLKQPQQ
ncbi:MAG: hypothetical protein QNJ44_20725 [Rhodobacter sp.]|nr:hypothetical protein [Rhodobacter sp.]